jgi:hypothetical protein
MANLTEEEDKDLKRAGIVDSEIRRDFSVIHSKSMKKNHLFLGPARFVNVRTTLQIQLLTSPDPAFSDSTTVTTTANFFEKAVTSHSGFFDRSQWERR